MYSQSSPVTRDGLAEPNVPAGWQRGEAVAIAALLLLIGGCRSQDDSSGKSDRLADTNLVAVAELLEHFDSLYDPAAKMVAFESLDPGYHSRLSRGTRLHPTRESLIYAHALLQRDSKGDARRAREILDRVLSLQDADRNSFTCGVWPWYLEEPIAEMPEPDLNWADFCGASVCHMLVDHTRQLPQPLRQQMQQSLRLAADAIRQRDVGPAYTNIAVLGGGVCAAAGECLPDPELLEYGRARLQSVVEHVARNGGFSEYNSPPYTKVVIAECERTLHLVQDPRARQAAEDVRIIAWRTFSESFHPSTQQWAGPHSRTSRDRLRASTTTFLSRRLDFKIKPHPTVRSSKPRGHGVIPARPCPEPVRQQLLAARTHPRQIRRTFVNSSRPLESVIGTTWFSDDACLGSINHSTFWTQRRPLIGYWCTDEDPAVVFRVRFLHDGRDFASMGLHTAQENHRALCLLHSVRDSGDWHPRLDRPDGGVFAATDLRFRFELNGVGVSSRELQPGVYSLTAGNRRVVIHTTPSYFDGQEISWSVGTERKTAFVDAVAYQGASRDFDFNKPLDIRWAVGIELLPLASAPTGQRPSVRRVAEQTEAEWPVQEELRVVHIIRSDG